MYSILHISDLHRSPSEPVDNDSLTAALMADRDRYLGETPIVPSPDAIIVSGDLIQGARMGGKDWQQVMRDQYAVAAEFLDKLANRFLGGDRSKVILVPGNHDVCWNTSHLSMKLVEKAEYPPDLRSALTAPESLFRWSWKDRALYQIHDLPTYESRLIPYWEFVENFYAQTSLVIPIDRNRGYQLFELNDRRIVVGAFDSTIGNDCFRSSGALAHGAVARCNLALRDIPRVYDLRIAVWHHSIQGPPMREDYMDVGHVHEMIGLGFQLGLHGHQHVAAATTHYIHLSESTAMAVVSAGSLCAGARELPRGVNRQYNVVVIGDDFRSARVHAREMVEGEQFSRKSNGAFLQGFVKLDWQPYTDAAGRLVDARVENERNATLSAERALRSGNPEHVSAFLAGVPLSPGSYARGIAVEAARKINDWPTLIAILDPPDTIGEAVQLITALVQTNALDRASAVLANRTDIDPATRELINDQIAIKKFITKP